MLRSFSLLLCLAACSGPPVDAPRGTFIDDDLSRRDVRGTAESIDQIARQVSEIGPERRAQASDALGVLSVSCPYTRSALQLPFALREAVSDIDAERFDPLVQRDWRTLQDGLATHVEVLEALEVDLAPPAQGDPLHGGDPGWVLDRETLIAAADPIAATALLIDAIPALAASIDGPARERIEALSAGVEQATGVVRPCPRGPQSIQPGQPWSLGMQLGGWHDALRRVAPFTADPEAAARVDAMIALLDAYEDASFGSRASAGSTLR